MEKNNDRDKGSNAVGAAAVEATAADWLARQDGGDWSSEEQRRLERWLDGDTRHRVAWLRLRAAWRTADALGSEVPAAAQRPRAAANQPRWRMVAGLLVTCALGALLTLHFSEDEGDGERYATRIGENRTLALADGSRLMLNTATRLRTAPDNQRHVWLDEGEAYFDIAHDPAHPFVIDAGGSRVTVLGTRFTVRREPGGTRVLVAQGRVRLSDATGNVVELGRNEEAVAKAGTIARAAHSEQGTEQRLAWREGRLVFDQATLAEAAAEFNRYNERRLVVDDPAAAAIVIGGSFAPTNVEGFTRLLEQGFGLRAQRHADRIVLTR